MWVTRTLTSQKVPALLNLPQTPPSRDNFEVSKGTLFGICNLVFHLVVPSGAAVSLKTLFKHPFSAIFLPFREKRPRTFVHLFVKSGCTVVVVNPNTFLLAAMEQSRSHLSTPVLSLCVGGFLIERDTETSRTTLSHTRKTWNRAFFFSPHPLFCGLGLLFRFLVVGRESGRRPASKI